MIQYTYEIKIKLHQDTNNETSPSYLPRYDQYNLYGFKINKNENIRKNEVQDIR